MATFNPQSVEVTGIILVVQGCVYSALFSITLYKMCKTRISYNKDFKKFKKAREKLSGDLQKSPMIGPRYYET